MGWCDRVEQLLVEAFVVVWPTVYTWNMSVTLNFPVEAQARLEAEASRRGVTLDQLIVEIADRLPAEGAVPKHRLGIVGVSYSGRGDLSRRHREVRVEQTAGFTAIDF